MLKKAGEQSIVFQNPVSVLATASTVGPKEGEGPLAGYFDVVLADALIGQDSWEKAESKISANNFELAIQKSGIEKKKMDYVLAGDLLNQNAGSTFGVRDLGIPFFGIFGACSTIGEGMSLGAILIDGEFAENVLVGASSHFCAAEKQFRFPLELGTQRPLTSSWTVTGHGAVVLTKNGFGPYITCITTGKIIDQGITDSNNMGAAMAPAAVSTLSSHFKDTGRTPDYYDLIITGDLGYVGHEIVNRLMKQEGYNIEKNYTDCGIEIFDREKQDTHSGGSGCACAAVTFAGYFYDRLKRKQLNKILLVPTGALMSPTTVQQGESIPGIAHAVAIENSR